MKTTQSLLTESDSFMFDDLYESIADKLLFAKSEDDIQRLVESLDLVQYKIQPFMEYLDKNKDKLLSIATNTEGQAVTVSNDYAPHANKHGKVISKGEAEGTIKVSFEDGDYDIPAKHLSQQDAIANESKNCDPLDEVDSMGEKDNITHKITEMKCFALLENDKLVKIITENLVNVYADTEQKFKRQALVIFTEDYEVSETTLAEEVMSSQQKAKRERIVMGLKKNKDELEHKYGDRWESVMYAIATKKAMEESKGNVIFKHSVGNKTIEIIEDGNYYAVEVISDGQVVDKKEFSSVKEAEAFAQSNM